MKRKSMAMIAPAFAVLLASAGCDDGNDTDQDSSTDAAWDQPSTCRQDPDPLNPHYRMTMLDITSPERLDNPTLEQSIIAEAIAQETFLWLIRFQGVDDGTTDTDGTALFETGSGLVEDVDHNGCFPLLDDAAYPIVSGLSVDVSGHEFGWPAGADSFNIDIPVFNWDYTFLLELPLKDVRVINGTFSADRTTIGTQSGGSWTCGAELTGMITVADAREVMIAEMSQHLCALLSGQVGDPSDPSDDCEGDPTTWPTPPDTEYMGEPAYAMEGCFAAEQVIVID